MKWLNEPFLKSAIENLYVRFTIGDYSGKAVCRMCKVVNVDLNGKPYKLSETGELLYFSCTVFVYVLWSVVYTCMLKCRVLVTYITLSNAVQTLASTT